MIFRNLKFILLLKENQNDNPKRYLLVIEYTDSSTFQNYLQEHFDNLTWDDKLNLAFQLVYTISCLHSEEILHHDLVIHSLYI
ncbi:hypothetical protein C1645_786507, partial [Glomus cerebriforme]